MSNSANSVYYPPARPTAQASQGSPLRTLFAVILIVVGLVLAPISLVSVHAKDLLTDTDEFVAAFSPLAQDAQVQELLVDAVTSSVMSAIDESLTGDWVQENLASLNLSDATLRALSLLEGSATKRLETLVEDLVGQSVASEQFSTAWEQSLRITHTQLNTTLRNDPNSSITLTDEGVIKLQLGPVIAEISARLQERGFTLAQEIPEVNRAITLAQLDSLVPARSAYSAIDLGGTWLPWITIAALLGGILAAKRRRRTVGLTALFLTLIMGVTVLLIGMARSATVSSLGQASLSEPVARVISDSAVRSAEQSIWVVGAGAAVVALAAWLIGALWGGKAERPSRID